MRSSTDPSQPAGDTVDPATRGGRVRNRWWYVLLLLPFVGLLWVPWYARSGPELWGFPFFYWYQFAWVFAGAGITGLVYVLTTTSDEEPPPYPADAPQPGDVPSEEVR